jgi:hypothetical protein
MSPQLHQRLLSEATLLGAEEVLRLLPSPSSPALEQAIHWAVRQSLLHYAEGLDTLERRPYAAGQAGKAGA